MVNYFPRKLARTSILDDRENEDERAAAKRKRSRKYYTTWMIKNC